VDVQFGLGHGAQQRVVEGFSRQAHHPGGAVGVGVAGGLVGAEHVAVGCRADHQRTEGVLPHRPGEAEEGVHVDAEQQEQLQVQHQGGGARREGQFLHQLAGLVAGAQRCGQAADDEDGGGGKEAGCRRQVLQHRAVDDAHLATGAFEHPGLADAVGAAQHRAALQSESACRLHVAHPAHHEDGQGGPVGSGQDAQGSQDQFHAPTLPKRYRSAAALR
jgi:hypothetical protein